MSHSDWCWACQHTYFHEDDDDDSFYDHAGFFDIETLATRLPGNDFDFNDMTAHFGVDRITIIRAMRAGRLQSPAWREGSFNKAHWTRFQVALCEFNGGVRGKANLPSPCGTVAAYKRHLRKGESCLLCRLASNRHRRTYDKGRKR